VNPRPEPIPPATGAVTATATTSTDAAPSWCPACKAYTVLTGVVLMLTPNGTCLVGRWVWCEICDDPADQPRRPRYAR
jgi:hypothetical protein